MNSSRIPMKAKHQRMALVVLALVAIVAAGLIAAWTLRNQANYFYLPEQMVSDPPAIGQAVRLGGMVQPGSIEAQSDGVSVSFVVTGNTASTVPVSYSGILPDLFVEGSGVVAEGSIGPDGTFRATNLLAKHDENYMPRELEGLPTPEAAEQAAETVAGLE